MIRSLAALTLFTTAIPLVQAAERESERLAQARGQAAKLATVSSFRSAENADDPGWRTASTGKLRYLASSTAETGWNYYGDREGSLYLMKAEEEPRAIGSPEAGSPVVALVVHREAPENLMAQTASATIYMSRDSGTTWQMVKVMSGTPAGNAFPMAYDPLNNEGFVVGDTALYRTRNGGQDWEFVVEHRGDGREMARVSAISMSLTEPQVLMAGFNDGTVYTATLSQDRATIAAASKSRPRAGMVSAIALSPVRADVAYVGYSEFSEGHGNVFLTRSAGNTWEAVNGGNSELPDAPVNALKMADEIGNRVYVLSSVGMFLTADGGARWMRENIDLGNMSPSSLTVTANSGGLYVVMASSDGRAASLSNRDQACYFKLFDGDKEERWMDMDSDDWRGTRILRLTSYKANLVNKWDCARNAWIPTHDSFKAFISQFSFDRLPNNYYQTISYRASIAVTRNRTGKWRQRGIFVDRSHINGGYRGFVVAISQGTPNSDSCQVKTSRVQEQVQSEFCSLNHTRYQSFDIGYNNGRCSINSASLVTCGNNQQTGIPSGQSNTFGKCTTRKSAAADIYEQPIRTLMRDGTVTCRMAAEEPDNN